MTELEVLQQMLEILEQIVVVQKSILALGMIVVVGSVFVGLYRGLKTLIR